MNFFEIDGVKGFINTNNPITRPTYSINLVSNSHSNNRFVNIHNMKAELPVDTLEMFRANDLLPLKAVPHKKRKPIQPVMVKHPHMLDFFQDIQPPENVKPLSLAERREQRKEEKKTRNKLEREKMLQDWMPFKDQITSDPYNTLFVSRLDYKISEDLLKYQFSLYGPVKSVKIVRDNQGKSRGYAFVQFQDHRQMINAYKTANNRKINSRHVLVDIQRGRTIPSWRPMRLGKGLGGQSRLSTKNYQINHEQRRRDNDNKERQERRRSRSHRRSRSSSGSESSGHSNQRRRVPSGRQRRFRREKEEGQYYQR